LLHDLGVIARSYPELHALIETPQEPAWHPEGDVWIHTLMVLDQAALLRDRFSEPSERLQLMLGALCHDLGKPSTTKMGEKGGVPRIRSLGHEEAGEAPTRSLLARWTFGEDAERAAVAVAMQHLKPGMLLRQLTQGALTEETYANAVRKLIKRIFPVSWRVLLAAAEADHRGRGLPDAKTEPYEAGERFVATVSLHALGTAPLAPLIHGQDLIERGMTPGPQMGECIKRIEEARDRGEIRTREEALAYLDHL
jgi:tRNA nucleotidyltransferase (CCA-adding enzyme)